MNSSFWKNKKVLLTGHTGFKGSWLSLWLKRLNVDLIGFSNSVPTKPSLFELAGIEETITSITGDISDPSQISDVVKKYNPDIIIHMAAQSLVLKSYDYPLETFSTNTMGTVNLLDAIRKVDTPKVVLNVTSDKCYENKELGLKFKEDDPMGGLDPYSSSKGCAELVTSAFRNSFFNIDDFDRHHVAIASVRAGNVIGGGDWAEDRLIPDIFKNILVNKPIKIRNPGSIRPWQFILDALYGYLLLIEKLWDDGIKYSGAWNFGSIEDARTVSWITKKLSELWDVNIDWEFEKKDHKHEAKYLELDCSKSSRMLDWKPKMDLSMTLEWIVNWYKQYQQKNDIRLFTEKQIEKYNSL
jgi:CDP-glucose 4,6-dehydratase